MVFASAYCSKQADARGYFLYSDEENAVWNDLISQQMVNIQNRADETFLRGIEALELPHHRVPQVKEVNDRLNALTGFGVEAVPAMIAEHEFFGLLANRKFPVATFIRTREELNYLKEPDIFHEIFGHCPLLTHPAYCDALESFGRAALTLGPKYFDAIHRIFWFTVEFGLVDSPNGLRYYGAGIASSPTESITALSDPDAERLKFDTQKVIQRDYRIDILQPSYFVMPSLEYFYDLATHLTQRLPTWLDFNANRQETNIVAAA